MTLELDRTDERPPTVTDRDRDNLIRGLMFGLPLSLVLWAAIILGVRSCVG